MTPLLKGLQRQSPPAGVWLLQATNLAKHQGTGKYAIALSAALVNALVATSPDTAVLLINASSAFVDADRNAMLGVLEL